MCWSGRVGRSMYFGLCLIGESALVLWLLTLLRSVSNFRLLRSEVFGVNIKRALLAPPLRDCLTEPDFDILLMERGGAVASAGP